MQVIIHSNSNGGVSVTIPTGEISTKEVLEKDCPDNAFIIDDSELPQGADAQFFDAWELVDNKVTVNLDKAKASALNAYNAKVLQEAQARQLNTLAGITNDVDDATWLAGINAGREKINSATSTSDLV